MWLAYIWANRSRLTYNFCMTEQEKEIMMLHYATLFWICTAHHFYSGMVKKTFQFHVWQVLVTTAEPRQLSQCSYWLWAGRNSPQIVAAARDLSILQNVHTGSGTHPPSYSMGTRPLSPTGKVEGPEYDHSPPSRVEVTHEWKYAYTLPIHLQGMYRDNFLFTCT